MFKFTLLIIFFLHSQNAWASTIGQDCATPLSENGFCKFKKNCERAIKDESEGTAVTMCPYPNYVGLDPIVCCVPMEVDEKEFPHMVLLGYDKTEAGDQDDGEEYSWQCGGALISELYVLSSANCNEHYRIKVVMLGISKKSNSDQRIIRGAEAVHSYDPNLKYDKERAINDILLIKLNESVSFNEYIKPACLPSANFDIGRVYTAPGWGANNNDVNGYGRANFRSYHLRKDELYKVPNCKLFHYKFNETTQLCAGSETEFINTCHVDTGGSLVIQNQDKEKTSCRHTVVGIFSLNWACKYKLRNTHILYTRVSAYAKWIDCRVWNVGCDLL